MKVISGYLKGRKIEGFDILGTRPTMDRVKESMFAMIQDYLYDSVVLDLFSGSGNLGIEAISNGSKLVYFNDINKKAVKVINKNIIDFNISEKVEIFNYDYKTCLDNLNIKKTKLDLVFLDPPYNDKILNDIIDILVNYNLLNNNGLIVCEVSDDYLKDFAGLERIKARRYGDKEVIIYKKSCK